jgi:hypothetical protein
MENRTHNQKDTKILGLLNNSPPIVIPIFYVIGLKMGNNKLSILDVRNIVRGANTWY